MDPTEVFSSKAEKYARYRWDYAPEAIQTIFDVTRVSSQSLVADIGAGTGILTKHFIGKVKLIFAIEPNPEMRQLARNAFEPHSTCHIIAARSEATTLPDHSVDLITAAQATNWFDPLPTRSEFLRILKPVAWLAILRNYGTDTEIGKALEGIYPKQTDTFSIMKGLCTPPGFYYPGNDYLKHTFARTTHQSWDEFFGALSTASFAPDEDSPFFPDFASAAKRVFDQFSTEGVMVSHAVTELYLGHITESSNAA